MKKIERRAVVCLLLAMVLLELAIIPIMIRLFPKFTAQEPLIKGRQQ